LVELVIIGVRIPGSLTRYQDGVDELESVENGLLGAFQGPFLLPSFRDGVEVGGQNRSAEEFGGAGVDLTFDDIDVHGHMSEVVKHGAAFRD